MKATAGAWVFDRSLPVPYCPKVSRKVEFGATTALAIVGLAIMAGQDFRLTPSSIAIFVLAILVLLFALLLPNSVVPAADAQPQRAAARQKLGSVLERLTRAELSAYQGTNGEQYEALLEFLRGLEREVEQTSIVDLKDESVISRYRSVNVLDVQLDEATRMHFISRAQGSFWTVYQRIRGQRQLLERILSELNRWRLSHLASRWPSAVALVQTALHPVLVN